MHRIILFLASIVLPLFLSAAKLSTTPSMLVMQGEIGMQIDVEDVQTDVPFNVFVDGIANYNYTTGEVFKGSLALALISEDGEIKELIHEENDVLLSPGWGFGQWQRFRGLKVSVDISDNDIIRFITKADGDEAWCPVTSSECEITYWKAKGNTIVKSKITVNIIGKNDIPCRGGYGWADDGGEYKQHEPVYSSDYSIIFEWPEGKDHHFVKVEPSRNGVQVEADRVHFNRIEESEYVITLMACSDDELIKEQRHFTVESSGTLAQLVNDDERFYLNNISVSGNINILDFLFMRDEMPMLEHIDLSNASLPRGILPASAFECKEIKTLLLPKDLKGLEYNSLAETKLKKLDIPESVSYYGLNAFNSSKDLKIIVLRNPNVTPVSWCVLEETDRSNGALFVPAGTREAFAEDEQWGQFGQIIEGDNADDFVSTDDGTYSYTGVYPNITISKVNNASSVMIVPETVELEGRTFTVTNIGERAFASSVITEIHIPKSVVTLGKYAIESSSCWGLSKIEVDEGNPVFFSDGGVLYNRVSSTLLSYPRGKREVEYVVPEGITIVHGWACYNYFLSKITFPSTLQNIGPCAFGYGGFYSSIITCYAENPPQIGTDGFSKHTYDSSTLYVPTESLDLYKSHNEWGLFSNILPIPDESGINDVRPDSDGVDINGNNVSIRADVPVEIHGIDGKIHYKGLSGSIDLPTGIYILRINGKAKKILIR